MLILRFDLLNFMTMSAANERKRIWPCGHCESVIMASLQAPLLLCQILFWGATGLRGVGSFIGLVLAGPQVKWCLSQCGQDKERAQRLDSMPKTTNRTLFLDFRICFRTCNLDLLFLPSVSQFCIDPKMKQIKTKLFCFVSLLFSFFSSDGFLFLLSLFSSLYAYLKITNIDGSI